MCSSDLSDALAAHAPGLVCARALAEIPPRDVWLAYHRDARGLARVKRVAEAIDAHLRASLLRGHAALADAGGPGVETAPARPRR